MAESATKRVAKNISWLTAGNLASGLANFLAVIYVARVLGAADFGQLQFAMAFLSYLALLVDSGLSMFGMREIARSRQRAGSISLNLFLLRFAIALFVYLAAAAALFVVPLPAALRWLFLTVFLLLFNRALNADWVFQGLERMEFIGLAKFTAAAGSLVLIFLLVRSPADLLRVPLVQAVSGILVSAMVVGLLFQRLARSALSELSVSEWPRYLIAALPLGASLIMIQIYNNLDTIMLGFMSSREVVGYYNAAYQVFYVFVGLFYIWLSVAMPVMNRRFKDDLAGAERFITKYARLTALGFVPLIVLTFITAGPLIRLVFGAAYAPASAALAILIWNLFSVVFGSIFGALILIPAGRFNRYFYAVLAGAAVNFVFNFILIPPFSFYGAALATLLAEGTAASLLLFYAREVITLSVIGGVLRALALSLAGALACLLVFYLGGALPAFARLLAGAAAFAAVYCAAVLALERRFIFGFVREIL